MRFFCFLFCLSAVPGNLWSQSWQAFPGVSFSGNTLSWADIDGDGDLDVYSDSSGLFLNNITSFSNASSLLPSITAGVWTAAFADYDNDGKPDLHLGMGSAGNNMLLRNQFPASFVDVAPSLGYVDAEFCQPAYWGDYNNDGLLDMYVTHEYPGQPNEFWQNLAPAQFVPRFQPGGVPDPFGLADRNAHAYGLAWGDIDLDNDIDIVTCACGGGGVIPNEDPHNKVFENETIKLQGTPADRYHNVTQAVGVITPTEIQNGSDSYWAILFDYDGDAFPDLYIGENNGQHRLWRNTGQNAGDLGFQLVSPAVHGLQGGGAYGRTAVAGDYDNDGDLDLYQTATGLFENDGNGHFTQRSYIPTTSSFRDAVWVDFDMDGDLDLANQQALYVNPGNGNHWLAIELVGDPALGTAINAHNVKIKVVTPGRTQYREHRYQVGTYSQHLLPTHFGLGTAATVQQLVVTWPNQTTTVLNDVAADQYVLIHQTGSCSSSLVHAGPASQVSLSAPVTLEGSSSNGNPLSWSVKDGPSHAPTQFSTISGDTTVFTPLYGGRYILSLRYTGCTTNELEFTAWFLDLNLNGIIDAGERDAATTKWSESGAGVIDGNGNERTDIQDLLLLIVP